MGRIIGSPPVRMSSPSKILADYERPLWEVYEQCYAFDEVASPTRFHNDFLHEHSPALRQGEDLEERLHEMRQHSALCETMIRELSPNARENLMLQIEARMKRVSSDVGRGTYESYLRSFGQMVGREPAPAERTVLQSITKARSMYIVVHESIAALLGN